jgi:hypothetical protein
VIVGVCRMITQQRVDVVVDGGAVVGSSNYLLLLARDQRWRSACVLCDSAQGNGQDQWTVRCGEMGASESERGDVLAQAGDATET